MQFVESPGDNLLLLASCSAPFSRALGRQPKHTRVEGADNVMQSSGFQVLTDFRGGTLPSTWFSKPFQFGSVSRDDDSLTLMFCFQAQNKRVSLAKTLAGFESAAYAGACNIVTGIELSAPLSPMEFLVWTPTTGAAVRGLPLGME